MGFVPSQLIAPEQGHTLWGDSVHYHFCISGGEFRLVIQADFETKTFALVCCKIHEEHTIFFIEGFNCFLCMLREYIDGSRAVCHVGLN